MKGSLIFAAQAHNEVEKVKMNEVWFLILQSIEKHCIDTSDLNGCIVVAIILSFAAILTHIPSTSDMTLLNPQAEDQNMQAKMNEVAILFHQHQNYFLSESTTWVISAVYEGMIALSNQKVIIEEKLQQMRLISANIIYIVKRVGEPCSSAHNTVFVDAQEESSIVYVNDWRVN